MTHKKEIKPKLLKDLGQQYASKTAKRKHRYGLYECPICKNPYRTMTSHIKSGASSKCKTCASKQSNKKHGDKYTRLYQVHQNMLRRCLTETNPNYKKYYGRHGVTVCDEWKDYLSFKEWALSNGYQNNLTIDRIDNNGNYEPSNCRWVSMSKQMHNTRRSLINKFSVDELSEICECYANSDISQKELCDITKISKGTMTNLLKGRIDYAQSC